MPHTSESGTQDHPRHRRHPALRFAACAIPPVLFALLAATACTRTSDRKGERLPVGAAIEDTG